jgi:hypothetical protein
MANYIPLNSGQEIVIGAEENQEYHASVLYYDSRDAPDDNVRMRGVYVTGNDGYVLGIAYRFMKTNRIYIRVFMPTKQGTPRVRASDRRKHTRSGFFDAGTSDAMLLDFVRKVAFE